jgi:hypothetical protein
MARGRIISKSWSTSKKRATLYREAGKLAEFCLQLFPLLIAHSDDYGRLDGDAETVKLVCDPGSPRPLADFDKALRQLTAIDLVQRYEVNGTMWLQIVKFDEHQPGLLSKRTNPRSPAPPTDTELPENSGNSVPIEPNLTQPNVTEPNRTKLVLVPEGFAEFWAAYPKKKAKDDAKKAWDKRRPDAALLQVMLESLQQQCQSPDWRKEDGRYIPFPATWLNRGQWNDSAETLISARSYEPWVCPHEPECKHPAACRIVALRKQA